MKRSICIPATWTRRIATAAAIGCALWVLLLAASAAAQPEAQEPDWDSVARQRAASLFAVDADSGELPIEAAYVLWHAADGAVGGTLQVLLEGPFEDAPAGAAQWTLSLLVEGGDAATRIAHRTVSPKGLATADAWLYETPLAVDEEAREVVVVLSDPATGRWGAAVAELVDEPFELPEEGLARVRSDLTWTVRDAATVVAARPPAAAGAPTGAAPAEPPPEAQRNGAVRILPLEERRPAGAVKIETLVGDLRISKVEIYLDGVLAGTAEEPPFDATVTLAGPGTEQTVRAVAYSGNRRMGEDSLRVNRQPPRPFRVRITGLTGDPAQGSLEVRAEVSVPEGATLTSVEYWFNDQRQLTQTAPPFTARVPTPDAGPNDFIRVAATLADGRTFEDVALLTSRGVSEELDVTLVELFVFATDGDGRPVRDLDAGDFRVRVDGRDQKLERVDFATEVPLALGLVVDTSGSMEFMMDETKRAASGFLQDTVTELDQAFVVDFDTLPKLRQASTGDLVKLYAAFREMVPNGYTALYDAILFALSELDEGPQRRALVLLTDGDDYKSRFGGNRCVRAARALGVPVYIIGLGNPRDLRGFTRLGLEAVTAKTGGRLYFVEDPAKLAGVYSEINQDLRSQYLVTFYSDRPTAEITGDEIEVKINRRGVDARVVVSSSVR